MDETLTYYTLIGIVLLLTMYTGCNIEGLYFMEKQAKLTLKSEKQWMNDVQERPVRMNSKLFQHNLFSRAKQQLQTIVLPEVCGSNIDCSEASHSKKHRSMFGSNTKEWQPPKFWG